MAFPAPALILLVPLATACLVLLTGRRPNLREGVSLTGAVVTFLLTATLAPTVLSGEQPSWRAFEVVPGMPLELRVEPLGYLFALVASFLWIFNTVFSIGYMRSLRELSQTRFYTFFAIAIGSTLGVALAGNLFTLFIFYEALTFSTFPLVTHKRSPEAVRAGRIYLGFLLGTSTCFFLVAMVWTWNLTGTLDFRSGGILAGQATPGQAGVLLLLFVIGTGKVAVMPFHFWLPAAMVAPTPVSALLHAVAVVKAGAFTVLKVCSQTVGLDVISSVDAAGVVTFLAGFTMVTAAVIAITQDNLKARLAYSTVSQLSYMVLGASLGVALGIRAGGLHLLVHAFSKITLFFCAGAIYVAAKKTRVSELDGLARRMPVTMTAFLIASLSNIGLPPLAGIWSKWFLVQGAFDADSRALVAVILISSLLAAGYLLPVCVRAFYRRPVESERVQEAPWPCLLALGMTALGCVALFFLPDFFDALTRMAA